MKFERCMDSEVIKFLLLADDYTKVAFSPPLTNMMQISFPASAPKSECSMATVWCRQRGHACTLQYKIDSIKIPWLLTMTAG